MNQVINRSVLIAGIDRLVEKYRVLASLRARREEFEAVGRSGFSGEELGARRDAFRRLAAEFPGALRELDSCDASVLRARLRDALEERDRIAADPSIVAPSRRWIAIAIDYHATLRELLAVKLWLARTVGKDGDVTDAVAAAHAAAGGRFDRDFLAHLHHPPGGRVLPIVLGELGRRHGLERARLVRILFFG
jgi:hypothetical protein